MKMLPTGVIGQVIHDHEKKRPKDLEQLGEFHFAHILVGAVE